MTDERRERFAAAIAKIDCGRWGIAVPDKGHEFWHMWRALADAAMSVADAEMKLDESNFILVSGNADYWKREADRLRTALREAAADARNFPATTVEPDYSAGYRDGREDVARQVEVRDAATAEHHTVDGTRYLCHADDHYCPADG